MPHASLVLLVNKIMAEQEKKHKLQKEQYEIKVWFLQNDSCRRSRRPRFSNSLFPSCDSWYSFQVYANRA